MVGLEGVDGGIACGLVAHHVAVDHVQRRVFAHRYGSAESGLARRRAGACVGLVVGEDGVYYRRLIRGVDGSATSVKLYCAVVGVVLAVLGGVSDEGGGKNLQLAVGIDGTAESALVVDELAVAYLQRNVAVAHGALYLVAIGIIICMVCVVCRPVAVNAYCTSTIIRLLAFGRSLVVVEGVAV